MAQLRKGAGQAPGSWLFLLPDQGACGEGEQGSARHEALLPFPTQSKGFGAAVTCARVRTIWPLPSGQ